MELPRLYSVNRLTSDVVIHCCNLQRDDVAIPRRNDLDKLKICLLLRPWQCQNYTGYLWENFLSSSSPWSMLQHRNGQEGWRIQYASSFKKVHVYCMVDVVSWRHTPYHNKFNPSIISCIEEENLARLYKLEDLRTQHDIYMFNLFVTLNWTWNLLE